MDQVELQELLRLLREAESNRHETMDSPSGKNSASESAWRSKVMDLTQDLKSHHELEQLRHQLNQEQESHSLEMRAMRDLQATLEVELDRTRENLREAIRAAGQGSDPGKRAQQNQNSPTSGRGKLRELEKALEIERIQHKREMETVQSKLQHLEQQQESKSGDSAETELRVQGIWLDQLREDLAKEQTAHEATKQQLLEAERALEVGLYNDEAPSTLSKLPLTTYPDDSSSHVGIQVARGLQSSEGRSEGSNGGGSISPHRFIESVNALKQKMRGGREHEEEAHTTSVFTVLLCFFTLLHSCRRRPKRIPNKRSSD